MAPWFFLIALTSAAPAPNPGVVCMAVSQAAHPGDQSGLYAACLRRQTAARAAIRQRWAQYPAQARRVCAKPQAAGRATGYVEMLACLENARRE
jgi:hypothetical protein